MAASPYIAPLRLYVTKRLCSFKLPILLLLALGLGLQQSVHAQYLLTAISPPSQFTHDDLWNLSVTRTNTGDNYTQFYIALRIFNGSGQLEVKTNSATISLSQSVTVVNIGNIHLVKPFTINYYNATMLQQVIASGGLFPPGTYNVQYTLYGRPSDGEFIELADFALEAIVDAIWPPMLLTPEDGDTISVPNPILTWTPAFSSAFPGQIRYSLTMVKILPGQTKEQAITANPSFYKQNELWATFDVYSGSTPLDTGQRYAWQVSADAGGLPMHTEVWAFVMAGTPAVNPSLLGSTYAELGMDPESFVYKAKNMKLLIKYDEEYVLPNGYTNLNYQVYDHTGRVVASSATGGQFPISKGANYIGLNCTQLGLQQNQVYLLEITNLKNEKRYLRFRPQNIIQN